MARGEMKERRGDGETGRRGDCFRPTLRLLSLSLFLVFLICSCQSAVKAQNPAINASSQTCFPSRPIPIDRWRGEYFNNTDLSGVPAMVRDDTQTGSRFLDFDWKLG